MSPSRRVVPSTATVRSTGADGSATTSRSPASSRGRKRTRRSGSYRQLVTAGDVALGLGLMVGRPAARATSRAVRTAEQVSLAVGGALFESLPEEQQEALRAQTDSLAQAGHDARVDTVDAFVGAVVAETMSSEVVRSAMMSAVSQAMEEVVDAALPSVVDQLRSEIGPKRLDDMVRASVERVVPEVIERDLSNAIAVAAGLPVRTARGLARLPGTVLRTTVADEGYDE